jgi:two-component system, chemotaxis family, sensor kinase CheA
MDELLIEFLTETGENLAALDIELVKLEQDPNAPGLLANIFRLVHTVKGTSGFFGLPRLEMLAHAAESVLGRFRDGELVVTPPAITVILAAIDGIKVILAALEATEREPEGDDATLIAQLNALAEGKPPVSAPNDAEATEQPVEAPPRLADAAEQLLQITDRPSVTVEQRPLDVAEPAVATMEERPLDITQQPVPTSALQLDETADLPAATVELPTESEERSDRIVQSSEPMAAASAVVPADPTGGHESAVALQSIRVSVDLLENLMTTVSELVLSRNQLLQIARRQKDSEFATPLQRLNQVVSELQEGVMKTRMQPIGNAWAKLPRIVRDLAHETGKKVELVMKGSETELDRQVLELIKDPLTHMVRNSVDHGIEPPDERVRVGKHETGVIALDAFHQGGHIVIEIGDDGRGLSMEKIKAKVLAKGLASEAELSGLTEGQIQQFIFRPGFSTAEAITSVSGRGVGMDVVRTNIEKIGGAIELSSRPGFGSKFTIKIPLTLAIVSALIVEVAGERFAVPQTAVVELVRARSNGTSGQRIEQINNAPVLRLRDRLLPLVVLEHLLKLEQPDAQVEAADRFVVVMQVGAHVFGMIVDQVFDTEEIVVKPVAPVTRHVTIFSGNTILGDGSVIMILDPGGIAGAIGAAAASTDASRSEVERHAEDTQEKNTLLVFRAGMGGPKAVPLRSIARLEEFDRKQIESVNGQQVIQYRGKLTPLVPFDPMMALDSEGRQPALVFADGGRVMALLVDAIVDIVETEVDIHRSHEMPGIIGSAIIAGRATELIDASYFCKQAFQDWSEPPPYRSDETDLETIISGMSAMSPMELARAA